MSLSPRKDKVVELCKIMDNVGRMLSENQIEKEDYNLIMSILRDAENDPECWDIGNGKEECAIARQNGSETVLIDYAQGTYIWLQK